jgi:hypothetical protein
MWQDRLHGIGSSWKAVLLVTGLVALLFALGVFVTRTSSQPSKQDVGRVVRFGS